MERINAIVSEKESGKVVFSDYVTPDDKYLEKQKAKSEQIP